MLLGKIMERIEQNKEKTAIVTDGKAYTYNELLGAYKSYEKILEDVPRGSVVAVRGEFDVNTIGLMMALMDHRCIYVPISRAVIDVAYYLETAKVEYYLDMDDGKLAGLDEKADHPLYEKLRQMGHPGIVFFSSGTTGTPKAAVHDLMPYIHRFEEPGKTLRSMAFLLFDHAGGFNTVMHSISNAGLMVTLSKRTPDEVCQAIEKYKLELLPTSPTFLHMLLLGRYYDKYDLSSLKIISYGSEPMPASTLTRMHQIFPDVRMKQTYGLTELGAIRTKSKSSDSLWMKIGGDVHHQTKVVNGILYVRSDMAMLGYLNAEAPFDEEGWYNTGDHVEVDGDYFLIQGRDCERINVGGEKVYPAEVESVLLSIEGVEDAAVVGVPNLILGQVVEAHIYSNEDQSLLTKRIKAVCKEKLEKYKRPMKIVYVDAPFCSDRFKKKRS